MLQDRASGMFNGDTCLVLFMERYCKGIVEDTGACLNIGMGIGTSTDTGIDTGGHLVGKALSPTLFAPDR